MKSVGSTEPIVSVVIPCWNAEKYVARAIESVLKQSYRRIEVIAINDGSTDKTLDVLESYRGRIRVLSGPHRGVSSARNAGIFASTGQLIQFLDADDVLYEEKISSGVQAALQAPPKTIVVAPGEMELLNGQIISRPSDYVAHGDPLIAVLLGPPLQPAAPLYWKKDLAAVGGFKEGYCEDFDLHARFCSLGYKFQNIEQLGFRVHQTAGSRSSIGYGFRSYRPVAYARAQKLSQKNGTWTEERADTLSRVLLQDAEILFRIGDRHTAIQNIRASKTVSMSGRSNFLGAQNVTYRLILTLLGFEYGIQIVEFLRKQRRFIASCLKPSMPRGSRERRPYT